MGKKVYGPDSKCLNVGCENTCARMWKCKSCYNRDRKSLGLGVQTPEQRKAYRESHKDEIRAYNKQWEADNRQHRNAYQRNRLRQDPQPNRDRVRKWIADNPTKFREGQLMRNFGLTVAQYQAMWSAQGGLCKSCKIEMLDHGQKRNSVAIDHCHNSGIVRGLLCSHCNKGIGHFDDDPAKLRAAADYLDGCNPLQKAAND